MSLPIPIPVAVPMARDGLAVYKTVAVVGPPNAGKTTLFNRLTGLRQKVGNFPGVTVEHHTGNFRLDSGEEVSLIDLPGVYSLNPKSEDEKVTIDVLNGECGVPSARMPSFWCSTPTTSIATLCWQGGSLPWGYPPWFC